MDVRLVIAGVLTLALAAGHATIGLRWVLPGITSERMPGTPFGPPALTVSMIRVTWHVVTVFALAAGTILMVLALSPDADVGTVLLRGLAVMWLGATAMAFAVVRPVARNLLRLPVPLVWVVIAVLCWQAAT